MPSQQNRVFVTAVLLSLGVHALVLFGRLPAVQRVLESAAPSPPIVARLAEPQSAEPAPAEPPKVEPEKKAAPPPPVPPKPRERPPQAQKPPPVAAPRGEVPATTREAPAPEPAAAPAVTPTPPEPQAAAAASASAHARAAASEAALAQTIGQYRLQVIGAAREFNRYPPLARENNWEGAVEVQMRIRGDGALAGLGVRKGSGHDVLDEQALDMFRRAQQRVPLPSALRGRDFAIELKAIYRLKDLEPGEASSSK